jgi:hypothetical protein
VASHLFQLGFAGSQQREPIINFDGRAVFGLMASPPTSTEQIPGIFPVLGASRCRIVLSSNAASRFEGLS